jgi:diguanylate cyclase (GGDEF)-like protein
MESTNLQQGEPSRGTQSPSSRAVRLLIVSAIGALGFTCGGGLVVYLNVKHMVEVRAWIDHSQSVLNNLQTASQRLERVGYMMQLHQSKRDFDELRSAQSTAAAMEVSGLNLEHLVQDNPSQSQHASTLLIAIRELSTALDANKDTIIIPEREIRNGRTAISLLQEEERRLSKQRSDEEQKSILKSILLGGAFLGCSLLVILILFGFQIRDAIRRRFFEQRLSAANDHLEQTIGELKSRGEEASLLRTARDELQLCVTSAQAQSCCTRYLQALVPGSSGATVILNNSKTMLEISATWGETAALADGFGIEACCSLRTGRPRWRRPDDSEIHCSHFVGIPPERYLCVPLVAQGDTLGFAYLSFPTVEIADAARSRVLMLYEIVELASMAIAALQLKLKLENQSIRDSLTGLFNRRFMEVALERELHRASRRGVSVALLMLDVDHFKDFNDTFGHEAGDVVLREVGDCFLQSVRSEDIVCRYGGEEFVIILPEISEIHAAERAEKIRAQVNKLRVQHKGKPLGPVSISVGLAIYPSPANSPDELLRLADLALYEAKRGGRNKVQIALEAAIEA